MDSKQIEKILWANKWTNPSFIGCFAADEIPKAFYKYPCSIIINLDTKNKPGSHWVAAYIQNPSKIYYFDSLGSLNCLYPPFLEPSPYCITGPNYPIYQFLNRFQSRTLNKMIYQSVFAKNCADYCIYFIHSMCIGIPFDKIVTILDNQNDPNTFVSHFVYNMINYE